MPISKGTIRPLARLKDLSRGSIRHLDIHPARNHRGGLGFRTRIQRNHPLGFAGAIDMSGRETPAAPPPEEVVGHEGGESMLDHVGRTFGVQPDDDSDDDGEGN